MSPELWRPFDFFTYATPVRPALAVAQLALYLGLIVIALHYGRRNWRRATLPVVGLLVVAALLAAPQIPFGPSWLQTVPQPATYRDPRVWLLPFYLMPVMLAAYFLPPSAALVVGLATGLGHVLWLDAPLLALFPAALVGYGAAWAIRQPYEGRLFALLRRPLVAGPLLALLLPATHAGFALVDTLPLITDLAALDFALAIWPAALLAALAEGVLGGLAVEGVLWGVGSLRRPLPELIPHPVTQRLSRRLVAGFAVFAAVLMVSVLLATSLLSISVATQLVRNQIAHDVSSVVAQLPEFRSQRENLLLQYAAQPDLLGEDVTAQEEVLKQLHRLNNLYQELLLTDGAGTVLARFPTAGVTTRLTGVEQSALEEALLTGAAQLSGAQPAGAAAPQHVVSVVVPVPGSDGRIERMLVGRIPSISLESLILGIEGTVGAGSGFILDEASRIVAHPNPDLLLAPSPVVPLTVSSRSEDGVFFEGRNANTQVRELGYAQREPNSGWQVVALVPYDVVLRLAVNIGAPLGLLLLGLTGAFSMVLVAQGQRFAAPVNRLVNAAEAIAAGRLDTPIDVQGNDEIGRLGVTFEKMRRETRRREKEMALLLNVSQNLTRSFDSNQALPDIMRSAVRATGAVGARVIIMLGGTPAAVGQGPAHDSMARHDRPVAELMVYRREPLFLTTADALRQQVLRNGNELVRFRSLAAFPLRAGEQFLGVLWFGFREEHDPDASERALLNLLANQTTAVVENLRLFGIAEGGRRRLAAVLGSTVDPVLVIDENQRVVMANASFEAAFGIEARKVQSRALAHALADGPLRKALLDESGELQALVLKAPDGRVYEATISLYAGPDNKGQGRVAVLRDISAMKQAQEETESFIQDAAHELRTPLASMKGYVDMVPTLGAVSETQRNYLEKANTQIARMAELVEDMLQLMRLDSGVPLGIGPIRARWMVADMKETFALMAEAAGVTIVGELEEDLPTFYADPKYLRRALSCYVSNAIKYAPNSGDVRIKVRREGRHIIFGVIDQGPGIPYDKQGGLFRRFYRAVTHDNSKLKGHGLGLATVRSIAERHGGEAWCVSEPGVGSAFFFSVLIRSEGV